METAQRGGSQASGDELRVPLLEAHDDGHEEIASEGSEVGEPLLGTAPRSPGREGEATISIKSESENEPPPIPGPGAGAYVLDLVRLLLFYWALAADALLLKELYSQPLGLEAALATGATVGHHVLMSLLLIVRQGWLAAAGQACGFILTLNPFESLRPIPDGLLGLVIISVGFVAYVLIAASGLIFVAYCVVCYLVTALLFSLLILDLAALVVTVAPAKGIFKYTDLALVAHSATLIDKALLFNSASRAAGSGPWGHALLVLALKGSRRVARPVLEENLNRAAVGTGHGVRLSSSEEPEDSPTDTAASMVPEYLTPLNGGLLSPGQMDAVARVVCARLAGPEVWELELELSADQLPGRMLATAAAAFPNLVGVRIAGAYIGGSDAAQLSRALLSLPSLARLQLQGCTVESRGCAALARALASTQTLAQLDATTCAFRGAPRRGAGAGSCCGAGGCPGGGARCAGAGAGAACCLPLCAWCCGRGERERRKACAALARGIRENRTLRQLNLAGTDLGEAGSAAIAEALRHNKVLEFVNLAFCGLGTDAADCLGRALLAACQLRAVAASLTELPAPGARRLASAARQLAPPPKQPPSLECHLQIGSVAVRGIDSLEILLVEDEGTLISDTWQGITGGPSFEPAAPAGPPPPPPPPPGGSAAGGGEAAECSSRPADAGAAAAAPPPPPGPGPRLLLVVCQSDAAAALARVPEVLGEMDTLDLSGLGLGNAGACDVAETLKADPPLRRLVLADNGIGLEGAAALAEALRTNSTLQELDLSSNEFDDAAAGALADATRGARGLRRLLLLGNKTPFDLATLRALMAAEAASGRVELVLVEDSREALERLAAPAGGPGGGGEEGGVAGAAAAGGGGGARAGGGWGGVADDAARAADFYRRLEEYRAARRARLAGRARRAAARAGGAGEQQQQQQQQQQQGEEQQQQAAATAAAEEPPAVGPRGSGGSGSGGAAPPSPRSPPAARAAAAAAAAGPPSPSGASSSAADEDTCGVCFDNENHVAIKCCGHRLCVACYRRVWELSAGAATCPFCRAPLEGYAYLAWPLDL
ncbi:hypothetical protein Rsub_07777 [Raphidocelis subcapitata]|uniref:RING-type domain-containing protein n=1 Tax=Raphidocelis subcapitata TaxID=307507 RepID=A0A2V0P706_9CHLO|nr:hypothetical protein Rsub_07777 [Raphidocelis subcapitata]|eukprot:GBF95349.1 hypothetical protein Rsub_07777 [Raphidocelis subcapitata]